MRKKRSIIGVGKLLPSHVRSKRNVYTPGFFLPPSYQSRSIGCCCCFCVVYSSIHSRSGCACIRLTEGENNLAVSYFLFSGNFMTKASSSVYSSSILLSLSPHLLLSFSSVICFFPSHCATAADASEEETK